MMSVLSTALNNPDYAFLIGILVGVILSWLAWFILDSYIL